MRANRIDSNQPEIVAHFRAFGCSVLNISSLKKCCDLIVSRSGRSIFIEVKDGSKVPSARKLTPDEEVFKAETKWAWRLVESIKDADAVIAELTSTETIYLR